MRASSNPKYPCGAYVRCTALISLNSISTVFNSSCDTYFSRRETPNGDAAEDAAAAVPAAAAMGFAAAAGRAAEELAGCGAAGWDEPEAPEALGDDAVPGVLLDAVR